MNRFYKEQAILAGWLPNHVESLTDAQVKRLLFSPKNVREQSFENMINTSNRPTLQKFAVDNYGLNREMSRTISTPALKEYIKNESLYKSENLTYQPITEGPYYPGERAVRELNKFEPSYPTYPSYPILGSTTFTDYVSRFDPKSAYNPSLYSPSLYRSPFQLTQSDLQAINKKVGGDPSAIIKVEPGMSVAPATPPMTLTSPLLAADFIDLK
jgi:hypothetical protein